MTSEAPHHNSPPFPETRARTLRERAESLWGRMKKQPACSTVVLGAVLLIGWAGAPLANRAWNELWSLPHAERVVVCLIGVAVIVAATVRRSHLGWRRRVAQARLGSLIALAWAVVIAVVVFLVAVAWWVMGAPEPDFPTTLRPRALDALATRAFAIVAGLGAAALLVISYRRQRTTEADAVRAEAANARAELAAEREVAKLFTETFDSASDKLGSEHAAVRLAGVHALARLADEAPQGREDLVQMVIDVLCAYLRMPYTPAPARLPEDATDEQIQAHHQQELEFGSFREVRHTILRVIGDRLRKDTRWRGKDYDFTGVVFDGGDLSGAHFTGGTVNFADAEFTGGEVDFRRARFTGATVNFFGAHFTGGEVNFFVASFTGGEVDFRGARFTGATVYFRGAEFSGATVYFRGAEFSGGEVTFSIAEFSGGTVYLGGASFTGGEVDFSQAGFSGGTVSFGGASFTGGEVDFSQAGFSGGTVLFVGASFTGGEVTFDDVSGTRPKGLPPHLWRPAEGEGSESGAP